MTRRRETTGNFTVTGPQLDRPVQSANVGVCLALTHAARKGLPAANFYVRDVFGHTLYVVRRLDVRGNVTVGGAA